MEDSTVNLINKNGVFDGETLLKIELINKEKNEIENGSIPAQSSHI